MNGPHTHYCVYGSTVRLIGFCWSAKTSQEVNQQSTASKKKKKKKITLGFKVWAINTPRKHHVKSLGFTRVGVSITGFSLCLIDVKKEVCSNVSIMDKLNLTAVSTACEDLLHTTPLITQQLAFDQTWKHTVKFTNVIWLPPILITNFQPHPLQSSHMLHTRNPVWRDVLNTHSMSGTKGCAIMWRWWKWGWWWWWCIV